MNYDLFLSEIKAQISSRVAPEVQLLVQNMPRNNGTSYDGLILLSPDCNVSPTIYLTPYYHRYLSGVSLEDICSDILCTYRQQLPVQDFDTSLFTDFSKVKSRIIMRLVSYPRNGRMLSDVPFCRFYDLAIIFYCLLHADNENQASILVHNEHMELWETDTDTLCQLAKQNTPILLPRQVTPINTLLEELSPERYEERSLSCADRDIPMYVISNCYRTNGASAILYGQLMHHLAQQMDSDLILLPSSIHEFIALPAEDDTDLVAFSQMVKEVNETQLADDEVLADHAYYYDRKKRLISM